MAAGMISCFRFVPFLLLPGITLAGQAMRSASVLCGWQLQVTMVADAGVCGFDFDPDVSAAIEYSVGLMGRFIIDNSEIEQAELDALRARIIEEERARRNSALQAGEVDPCDPSVHEGMGHFNRDAITPETAAQIRAETKDFLADPRDPREGDCL
jgi:hypothetical protein